MLHDQSTFTTVLEKQFCFALRKPLTNDDRPLCKVNHPLPNVQSNKDVMRLILGTENLKHKAKLAVAYDTALRLNKVTTLRFQDISFTDCLPLTF